jgi:toxin-antitoxin system PIN domain toxin
LIVIDVNILVAAHRKDHSLHGLVRPWFDEVIATREPFAVPAMVWASFVRISTSSRIFTVPTPLADAFAFARAVRDQPHHVPLEPGERQFDLFEEVCVESDAAGDLAMDAYLAAFAIDHGCSLASLDRDFARFPGLTWIRPGS